MAARTHARTHRTAKTAKDLRQPSPDVDVNPQVVRHIGPKSTLVHVVEAECCSERVLTLYTYIRKSFLKLQLLWNTRLLLLSTHP